MALVTRGVRHPSGFKTTMRLSPAFWSAIADIARREGVTRDQVIARAWRRREDGLSEAVRSFCLNFYRHLVAQLEAHTKGNKS